MAREKNSPDGSAPKKAARKKASAKTAAVKPEKAMAAVAAAAVSSSSKSIRPSEEEIYKEISVRAYQIFCERGGLHGSDEADWHRAELEVRAKYEF